MIQTEEKYLPVRCDDVDLLRCVLHEHSHEKQKEIGGLPIASFTHHDLRIVAALLQ